MKEQMHPLLTDKFVLTILEELKDTTDTLLIRKKCEGHVSDSVAREVATQITMRQRATNKFPQAGAMLFDREGYEQSSHHALATYHASLLTPDDIVLEICTGIGADTIALSRHCKKVYTIDSDPNRIALARHNVAVCGNSDRVTFITEDWANVQIPSDVTAIFADPSRRVNGKRKVEPSDYQPTVEDILTQTTAITKVFIKLSPGCDYDELLEKGNVSAISTNGECKEILFSKRNAEAPSMVSAILLDANAGGVINHVDNTEFLGITRIVSELPSITGYIIEPDPGIIKASLVSTVAHTIDARLLASGIAYLTSEKMTDYPACTYFKITTVFPSAALKKIKTYLKKQHMTALSVKKRGYPLDPTIVQKRLGIKSGSNQHYLFLFKKGKGHAGVLAERVNSDSKQ